MIFGREIIFDEELFWKENLSQKTSVLFLLIVWVCFVDLSLNSTEKDKC